MSLQVNVVELLDGADGATQSVNYDGPWEADEPPAVHAKAKLKLTRTGRGVWVTGRVQLAFDAECSRCLVPFTAWAQLNIDEEYLAAVDTSNRFQTQVGEEESESFRVGEQHELDLCEAVRQYGIAAMPLAPVCAEKCAGLCPMCGANLNLRPCACGDDATGPFTGLKDLFATTNESR